MSLISDQRGVVAIEFALVLPLFMLVLLGMVDTSLILCDKAVITNASREAARAGIVTSAQPVTDSTIEQIATSYAKNSLVSMGAGGALSVVPTHPSGQTSGDPLTVLVTYTYNGFITSLTGPVTLSAETVMVYE